MVALTRRCTHMKFDFPTVWVEEGAVRFLVPRLESFVRGPSEYAPSKAPVFYNPAMELNRDVAVLALQAYQGAVGRELVVCEPLAGCGVRGIRFATEVSGVAKVVMNDLNPKAAELARFNVERNKLSSKVLVENKDANLVLSEHAAPRRRFDYVDIDPFGSPAPYMDSALRALRSEGLITLTATDTAPLCGVHPRACIRKYGGKPLRTEYCHELAVRILTGSLAVTAARQDIGVKPVFSHSTDHYVRVYALISHGAKKADESLREMGFIQHCFNCFHREVSKGTFITERKPCPECGAKMSIAGPLWLGKIADKDFCDAMKREIGKKRFRQKRRVQKLVSTISREAEAPVAYYVVDQICDRLGLPTPSSREVTVRLRREGYQATPTHFRRNGIKTDAPSRRIADIIKSLATSSSPTAK